MVSYLVCWFLLQASFRAVSSGTSVFAYSEMSFPLFSNLTFHKHINLYMNGNEKSVIIARWELENATIISEWRKDEYIRKIFIDIDKTPFIWICKGDQTDSAKYIVLYDINTPGPEVELAIIEEFTEKKQLHVCLNSPPNSPEKCFGKLTEEQVGQYIEKWLDDHPKFIKRYFGNLTEENIGDEFRKWLDDHPGFMKKYFEELTEEQIGQEIQKWLGDHPESFKKYFGKLTEQQDGQEIRKWLDDRLEFLKKHLGSSHLPSENSTSSYWTLALQLVTLLMLTLNIIFNKKSDISKRLNSWQNLIIARLPCHQRRQEPSQKDKDTVLVDIEKQETTTDDEVNKWHDHPELMDKNLEKLTDDQIREHIQKWLGVYLVFIKKHLENLTDDQIGEQIQKWLGVYPGLHFEKYQFEALTEKLALKWLYDHPDFIERNPGSYSKKQEKDGDGQHPSTTSLTDLGATPLEALTGREDNICQNMSLEENGIVFETSNPSSESYNENQEKKGEKQLPGTHTFKDLYVALKEPLTEINIDLGQRTSSEENGILETTNLSSGSYNENQEKKREKQLPGTLTFEDLGVALNEPLTERNIDLGQRMSSEENGILETTNLSSGSYNENQEKKGEKQLHGMPTFKDLGVTLMEPMTERNIDLGQRMSSEENGIFEITNLNAGSYTESTEKKGEKQLLGMPTFKDLGVILMEPLTERNIDLGQRMSSEENGIFEITNLSADLFYQSGRSLTQPINKEGDSGQTKSVKKTKHFIDEDSDADPTLPLLGDQKALNPQK